MRTKIILFFLIGSKIIFAQDYSNDKIKKLVDKLNVMVIDTVYFTDESPFEKFEKPKLEYTVNDNMTYNVFSTKPNFSDNETYSIFQKIYKKGKKKDFELMAENNNPAIRVYGLWALVKNKKFEIANIVLDKEKNKSEKVFWNSVGCLLDTVKTDQLMTDLIKNDVK